MKAFINIPNPMVAYARFYSVDPIDVAQHLLDEHGRECAEMLMEHDGPWDETYPDDRCVTWN